MKEILTTNKREKALELLLDWAIECGFGYDSLGDTFLEYQEELEQQNLGYKEGLIWIAEQEIKKHETNNI